MAWKKGQSGNPKGRPPKGEAFMDKLQEAIKNVETKKGKKIMEHMVERAFDNDQVLVALTKKLVPDLKASDVHVDADVDGSFILKWVKDD